MIYCKEICGLWFCTALIQLQSAFEIPVLGIDTLRHPDGRRFSFQIMFKELALAQSGIFTELIVIGNNMTILVSQDPYGFP